MLEPAFTYRNSTQIISNQNQVCHDLKPYMASMSTDSRRRFFRAKGEISRMRAHEWRKGEVPLVHSIKTNPKN